MEETDQPTSSPTDKPSTEQPEDDETDSPTLAPTEEPLDEEESPTLAPTEELNEDEDAEREPTSAPSLDASLTPSIESMMDSLVPTGLDTSVPSLDESMMPSMDDLADEPTNVETSMPSLEPTTEDDGVTIVFEGDETEEPTLAPTPEDEGSDREPSRTLAPTADDGDTETEAPVPTAAPSTEDDNAREEEPTVAPATEGDNGEIEPTVAPSAEDGGTETEAPVPTAAPSTEDDNTGEEESPLAPTPEGDNSEAEPTAAPSAEDGDTETSCDQDECEFSISINADSVDFGTISDTTFTLGAVSEINAVVVEVAASYGEDVVIILTAPTGEEYILMEDTKAVESEDGTDLEDFDLGDDEDDPTLANVVPYTFVETGGASGFVAPYSPEGIYNAEDWASDAPYDEGEWNLLIADNAFGDEISIGDVFIRYCGICPSDSSLSKPTPTLEPTTEDDASQVPAASPTTRLPTAEPTIQDASFGPAFMETPAPSSKEDASFGPAFAETPSPTIESFLGAEQNTEPPSPPTAAPILPTLPPVNPGECTEVIIDFEHLADGTKILGGSYLWNEYNERYGIVLEATGGFLSFPRLFNTTNVDGEEDEHLGSPNEACDPEGPGRGIGGEPGSPASNCVPLGNVLIIQNEEDTDRPNDSESGGVISFLIDDSRVESVKEIGLMSIAVIGTTIKVAYITSTGKKAPKVIDVDPYGENSVQTIPIDREKVFQVDVNLAGPGAVTHFTMCINL